MSMAKIDSGSRMRLPPDSALKPQPYSEREHATTAAQQRTLTDWFQLAQQQRQGQADPTLARAIETALQSHRELTTAQGHRLTVTVLGPSSSGVAGQYEARAGDQTLRIQSATPLQAGQNLLLTTSPSGPALVVPASDQQRSAMLTIARQAQLARLPTLQPQTSAKSIQALLNALTQINQAIRPDPTTQQNPLGSTTRPDNPQATPTPGTTNPEARALGTSQPILTTLLSRWLSTMPQAPVQPPNAVNGPATVATGAATATGQTPAMPAPEFVQTLVSNLKSLATPSTEPPSTSASQKSAGQHWISQLVQTAQQEYGAATAQTVRKVWQQWQQNTLNNLASTLPETGKSAMPAATSLTATSSAPVSRETLDTLMQQLPLLASAKTRDPELKPLTPPNDWWRLAAEQWLDLRTQVASAASAKPLSLEEQLRQQAQRLLHQSGPTYSPEQLKRSFALRRESTHLPNSEQQQLALIRQTLEQVNQQQTTRHLLSLGADTAVEQPRILHSIPVWSDQHLVWFDIERHPEPEGSEHKKNKPSRWCLDVHFHLPPMAPMCARLLWEGEHCSLQFLTDDSATLRMLHDHINGFQQRLQQMGLPVEEVLCRHGLPKRQQRAETTPSTGGHRVDIRT
ncbi:flagellar hook-length control protein FliK [Salinispirillum marinum]|uniref:Flagellar hook-length control protein FliK n=2 Tax=Saccharospirillaceae TaxID=255527 RepID=A0ABV8BDA2_9GAMM